ncbi:MAG: hypothetical protein ABI600_17265 [Luteolibacter sp.]
MNLRILFALTSICAVPLHAETRPWKSSDGLRSIQAEFVNRDAASVTVRLDGGKEFSIDLTELDPGDRNWLDLKHPLANGPVPDETAVFDTLKFGDPHDVVLTKLKASKLVELTMDESMINRTGLNGIFRIRQKIGGQQATLFFDWTDANALKEITVRTDAYPAASFEAKLTPCLEEFIELLSTLHGKPLQAAPKIDPASVPDGAMLPSHLWKIESGGSALLGVGCEGTNYQIIVRFTEEKIEPATTKRPAKPAAPDIDFSP